MICHDRWSPTCRTPAISAHRRHGLVARARHRRVNSSLASTPRGRLVSVGAVLGIVTQFLNMEIEKNDTTSDRRTS